jgi:hypothetical protein
MHTGHNRRQFGCNKNDCFGSRAGCVGNIPQFGWHLGQTLP